MILKCRWLSQRSKKMRPAWNFIPFIHALVASKDKFNENSLWINSYDRFAFKFKVSLVENQLKR